MRRFLPFLAASLAAAACTDPVQPRPASTAAARGVAAQTAVPATAAELFARYVALGTSNSMGVQSAGVYAPAQRAAWPAVLAARVGAPFSLPLVQDPGCGPPLPSPLAVNLVLVAAFNAFGAGDDLVSAVSNTCAPLQSGVVLPANSVAISGADVYDALNLTPELAAARSARVGRLYGRVLLPGQTQVAAMFAQRPTFVSVELAANDVLPASSGRIAAMTPYANWQRDYDAVLAAVASTGARAVLVGLPNDAANFPSVRRARELFAQAPAFFALGITVSPSCYFSSNHVFVPGYVLGLLSRAPTTATCADVPGATDYVLTAGDVAAINARMAQINAHIQARAAERGYAYFSLAPVYDQSKARFDLPQVLFGGAPFGPNMSLDGVHPNAQGQALLATAAEQAIEARYGVVIP